MNIDGRSEVVSHGHVIGQVTHLKGGIIPFTHLLVSFKESVNVSLQNCAPQKISTLAHKDKTPLVWYKTGVSRISLVGPFYDSLGSTILVDDQPSSEPLKQSVPSMKRSSENKQLYIDRADVICDIKLHGSCNLSSIPYACQHWYSIPALRHLKSPHFKTRSVPRTLKGLSEVAVEAFWDKRHINIA